VVLAAAVMVLLALFSTMVAGRASDRGETDTDPGVGSALGGRASTAAAGPSDAVGRTSDGEREAALTAYQRFWQVASGLDSQPEPQWRPGLAAVAADPVLSRVLSGLQAEAAAGHRQYGAVLLRPTIVQIGGGRASIVDCQDASRSGLADVQTGLPVTVGSPRTAVTAVLTRDPKGVWRVSDARYVEGPC